VASVCTCTGKTGLEISRVVVTRGWGSACRVQDVVKISEVNHVVATGVAAPATAAENYIPEITACKVCISTVMQYLRDIAGIARTYGLYIIDITKAMAPEAVTADEHAERTSTGPGLSGVTVGGHSRVVLAVVHGVAVNAITRYLGGKRYREG
jgi:hypothetical protein